MLAYAGTVFRLALFPHLTVFNNLAFPLRKTKMSEEEIKQRVGEIADFLY